MLRSECGLVESTGDSQLTMTRLRIICGEAV
jgi:hypothetical protein